MDNRIVLHKEQSASAIPTFAQQRLWFLEQLVPATALYNIPLALRIQGPLNIQALQDALNLIVERHEPLRTTFHKVNSSPVMAIAEHRPIDFLLEDLSNWPEATRLSEAERRIQAHARRSFDLSKDSMMRLSVLRLEREVHWVLFVLHHIAFDGWSRHVLFRELSLSYDSFCYGKSHTLSELSLRYSDYAQWQRQLFTDKKLDPQLGYWEKKLQALPATLRLSANLPQAMHHAGERQSLSLPKDLIDALKALSHREGVTLFMTLLSAFKALLFRYTNQEDIVVGSPIAGRTRLELENLIGLFVNTLPLRTQLAGDIPFSELLARVRDTAVDAYANQDLPFDYLVEKLQPPRDFGHNPLFDILFQLRNTPRSQLKIANLVVNPIDVDTGTSKFHLTISLEEEAGGLKGVAEYRLDMLGRETIQRFLGHYETLLRAVVADADRTLSQLPLLSEEERYQLLVEWNQTKTEYPKESCIHQLFEKHVEQTPEAIALVFDGIPLTYRELNERSNQLAHHLQLLQVHPEVLVGLCLDRSTQTMVAMLGILKAGGAYLPLDPMYPKERLQLMISESQAPIVLTQQKWTHLFAHLGVKAISLDTDWPTIALGSKANPVNEAGAENIAYVMYTSGSTGEPKGVCIPHRAVNRLVCNANYLKLSAYDKVAQASTISFDAATFETWGALLNGAQLVGVPHETMLSPLELSKCIRDHGITVLFVTTALFNHIAHQAPETFRALDCLLIGGEEADADAIRKVLQSQSPKKLLNGYGPTESTTFAAWYWIQGVPDAAMKIPIGRPVSNTQLYVLDKHLQPVPIGVPGELHIGGDGLAHGYLHRPALTAERFVPDVLSLVPGAKLYKTGDWVRYLADGNIEFLRRADEQIKMRGFLIEPREIETVLQQHPDVRESVVVAQESQRKEKRLIAYVLPESGRRPQVKGLRSFLKQKLPDYMIPSFFQLVTAWTLTANGKIDRHALPIPHMDDVPSEQTTMPRDAIETRLMEIWQRALGMRVSTQDNFFELGGHSLLIVKVQAQIQEKFNTQIPISTFFERPTIEELAKVLRERGWTPSHSSLVPIQPKGTLRPLFWVFPPEACFRLAKYLGLDQPLYGLRYDEEAAKKKNFSVTFEELAHCFIQEMKAVQPEGPYLLAGHSAGGMMAFEMARQLKSNGESIALLGLVDSYLKRLTPNPQVEKSLGYYFDRALFYWEKKKLREHLVLKIKEVKDRYITQIQNRLLRKKVLPVNPAWDAIVRAAMQYQPRPYSDRITLFSAVERYTWQTQDAESLCKPFAEGGLDVHRVPGDHVTLLQEPNFQVLAKQLKKCLDRAHSEG